MSQEEKRVMSPDHPDWFKFEEHMMTIIESANFFLKEHESSLDCGGTYYLSRRILEEFKHIDIDATLDFFKENGCTCDCQIMDKFFKKRTLGLHEIDNDISHDQTILVPKTEFPINHIAEEDKDVKKNQVQIADPNGILWFFAENVCAVLDIDMSQLMEILEPEQTNVISGKPIISQPGIYSAIFNTNTEVALRWQDYLINQVLPHFKLDGRIPVPEESMYEELTMLPPGTSFT